MPDRISSTLLKLIIITEKISDEDSELKIIFYTFERKEEDLQLSSVSLKKYLAAFYYPSAAI